MKLNRVREIMIEGMDDRERVETNSTKNGCNSYPRTYSIISSDPVSKTYKAHLNCEMLLRREDMSTMPHCPPPEVIFLIHSLYIQV